MAIDKKTEDSELDALDELEVLMKSLQENKGFEPEPFLAKFQEVIKQGEQVQKLIAKIDNKGISEKLLIEAKVQTEQLTSLAKVMIELFKPNYDAVWE